MNLHALLDTREYLRLHPNNAKGKPTGPLANISTSGTFKLEDSLSDESLAALYRAKLRAQGKI